MIFRFLGGFSGSAFLSIGGATISDLFTDEEVGTYVLLNEIMLFDVLTLPLPGLWPHTQSPHLSVPSSHQYSVGTYLGLVPEMQHI